MWAWLKGAASAAGGVASGGYSWLAGLASTFLGWALKLITLGIVFWRGKRAGRAAERAEGNERTLDAVRRAQAARRAVSDDPAAIMRDKYNRD